MAARVPGESGRATTGRQADAYRAARDEASDAVYELLLAPQVQAETLAVSIESNLMPAIAGLLRRMDRRRAPAPQ